MLMKPRGHSWIAVLDRPLLEKSDALAACGAELAVSTVDDNSLESLEIPRRSARHRARDRATAKALVETLDDFSVRHFKRR